MTKEKINGFLPTTRRNSTLSPSNSSVASEPEFVRSTASIRRSNISHPSTTSNSSQTSGDIRRKFMRPTIFPSGKINVSNQLRNALINNGPEYNYKTMKTAPVSEFEKLPSRRTILEMKNEFGFGMSKKARSDLFTSFKRDVSSGHATRHYEAEDFTNSNAVAKLRKLAIEWSSIQGNNIFSISHDDASIKEFLRNLASKIPAENRHAALAMIDQPAGYRQALPGTVAAEMARLQTLQDETTHSASNHTRHGLQAQQEVLSPGTNASASPAAVLLPLTAGKRSYSEVDDDSTSIGNQMSTLKRSKSDYVSNAFQPLTSYNPQPPSFLSAPNDIGERNQPYHLQSEPVDPSQAPQSSSWSASNGMDRPEVQQQVQPRMHPRMQHAYDSQTTNYSSHVFQGESLDQYQPQQHLQLGQQPQMMQAYDSGNMSYQTNAFQSNQFFDQAQFQPPPYMQASNNSRIQPSQSLASWSSSNGMGWASLQQQFQPPIPPTYYPGPMNYQPQFFQGASFHPSQQQQQQYQPQIQQSYNPGNLNYQNSMPHGQQSYYPSQFQPTPYMQESNNSGFQTFQNIQFNHGNASQTTYTKGTSAVGQPNYNVQGGSPSLISTDTLDDEWAKLMRSIEDLTPIVPLGHTQLTPTLPDTSATNQTTSKSTTAVMAQQPGTTG